MNSPSPFRDEPAERSAARARLAHVRLEVKLTKLARPPSPAERQAITTAVELALGIPPALRPSEPQRWRFSGRWWQPRQAGPSKRWAP